MYASAKVLLFVFQTTSRRFTRVHDWETSIRHWGLPLNTLNYTIRVQCAHVSRPNKTTCAVYGHTHGAAGLAQRRPPAGWRRFFVRRQRRPVYAHRKTIADRRSPRAFYGVSPGIGQIDQGRQNRGAAIGGGANRGTYPRSLGARAKRLVDTRVNGSTSIITRITVVPDLPFLFLEKVHGSGVIRGGGVAKLREGANFKTFSRVKNTLDPADDRGRVGLGYGGRV